MDYKNGKIYRVVCSETGREYIGSTCSTLVKRMSTHRNNKHNKCMTKDFIEPKIFLIEDYPCDRKDQLLSRERFYIESMDCVNKQIPTRTKKEWTEENKDYYKIYQKQYHQDNKDHLNQIKKEYREKNKDHLNQKKKEYRENNREKIKIQHKKFREKNLETIREKQKEKFNCECGGKFTFSNKSTHLKSKKHIKFSHSLQTSQPSDACPLPSVFEP